MKRFSPRSYFGRIVNGAWAAKDLFLPSARMRSRPFAIHVEFNDYCNLRCVHCLRHSSEATINSGRWNEEMFEKIMPWVRYAGYVGIAGLGEPFLERCLPAVLRKIIAAGAAPSVITNGTLIDDRLIEELVDIGPMLLDVSIDGATKETFEAIRKGGNFEAIVNNILRLQEAKAKAGSQYPVVQINWVWLKSNLHEVNELAALAEKMGAVAIRTQPVFLKGLSNMEHEAVTDAEVEQANREVRAHLNPSIDLVNAPLNTLQSGCSGNGAQDSKMFFCPNIWNTMQISPQGNVRVCCMGNFPDLGNIMEQSLEAIWNSPAMMSIRRAQMQGNPPDECRRCYLLQSHSGKAASRVLKQYRDILPLRNLLR